MLHIHKVEYYLTIKRNEVLTHVTTWMNLENIMLGERSQLQRSTFWIISFVWNVQNRQIHGDKANWWLPSTGILEENGEWMLMGMGFLCCGGKMLKNWLQWWLRNSEYTKNYLIVHFKCVNCMVCELYLNKAVIFLKL